MEKILDGHSIKSFYLLPLICGFFNISLNIEAQNNLINSPITCIDISPDGYYLVSGHENGCLAVWRSCDSLPFVRLTGHQEKVVAVRFIQHENQIVSIGSDSCIRWWDYIAGKEIDKWDRTWSHEPEGSDISDDGSMTIYITPRHSFLLDLKTKSGINISYALRRDFNRGFIIDPDTSMVILMANKSLKSFVLNFGKLHGRDRFDRKKCNGTVTAIAVTRPANLIATGNNRGVVQVVDFKTGKVIKRIQTQRSPVINICFSKDLKFMAIIFAHDNIAVYNTSNWNKTSIPYSGATPTSLIFSTDSKELIIGSTEGIINWVDIPF